MRSLQGRGLGWRLQDQKMLRHQNQKAVGFRDARAGLGQRELEKQRRCMITTARGSAGREGFWSRMRKAVGKWPWAQEEHIGRGPKQARAPKEEEH